MGQMILIVEDDLFISDMLCETLVKEGFGVLRAFSGTEALMILEKERPDLVLLDLMLPGLNGEEVLKRINGVPVIVLSAKSETSGKVKLLLDGADDYITKPFNMDELLARIAVQLRRGGSRPGMTEYEDIILDPETRSATVASKDIHLTRTEYAILKSLISNPRQVVTKTRLLELISGDTPDCTENTLKVHISNLRKKLRDASDKEYIDSVWGIGFKMR